MSPKLSSYSVHNISSSGVGVIPHPMRSRYSFTETDGQCTAHLALSMVTAPPTLERQSVTGFLAGKPGLEPGTFRLTAERSTN